ncbi:hypothetical protein SprV_0301057200 [Sparganum proliferum]
MLVNHAIWRLTVVADVKLAVEAIKTETTPCSPPPSCAPSTRLARQPKERYKVEIAETRFSEQGKLEEVGAGYTPGPHPGNRLDRVRVSVCACTHAVTRLRWPDESPHRHLRDETPSTPPQKATSETRFSEQGQLEEVGAGYTFFWSGRPRTERRDAGVAFAIRNDIVGRLPWSGRPKAERQEAGVTFAIRNSIVGRLSCLPQGINDHLVSTRLSLQGGKFATIYAPPMTSPD